MKRAIEVSGDGSTTLRVLDWDEPYHSRHGAIQESQHVFIQQGLSQVTEKCIRILEMGFGTGLNALLTFLYANDHGKEISYLGIEAFPLATAEWSKMNYLEQLGVNQFNAVWQKMHTAKANTWFRLSNDFLLQRHQLDFKDFDSDPQFNLIYFDAFGPRVQPELWSSTIFERMYDVLLPGGILVTYCSKGSVRRNMQEAGFEVEKLPGPPGKREMLRAIK